MDQMHYSLKIYMENVSIDFSHRSDSIWAISLNTNTCVVAWKVHEAAREIVHAIWWLLCLFVVFAVVLKINIRDLLLEEWRALFLVIELLHDNLPPWAIIKSDLIVFPKWHLTMIQLSESYGYNYLLIVRKTIPISLLPFPLLWWKTSLLKTKIKPTTTKSTAKKRKASENTFIFFFNWMIVCFKHLFCLS